MRHMRLSSLSLLAPIALVAFLAACDQSGPELPEPLFPPDPDLPEAVVDLPSPPPASAFEIKEFNDDGSLRVEGLIGNRDQYLGEEVEVRAIVAEIIGHGCDPTEGRCPRNRMFIRDHIDDDLQLRVVGYIDEFIDDLEITEGEEYLITGTYTQQADGFVSTENGLIELLAVDGEEYDEENYSRRR